MFFQYQIIINFMHDVLRLNQPSMKNPKISNFVARLRY